MQQPFLFTNTSVPAPVSSNWTFGDGTVSSKANPVKKYTAAGTYQVKLITDFGSCSDSVFKTITVSNVPIAAFISSDSISCNNPFTVNFTSQSNGAISYLWNFGDSTTSIEQNPLHTYTGVGKFTVQLIVANANGCTDTLQKTDFIKIQKPIVTLSNLPDSGCVPFTKNFISTTNTIDPVTGYVWNFGDGSVSAEATPTHTFTAAGVYAITLVETTAGGCTDTVSLKRGITASTKPVINFTASPRITCAKTEVKFTDLTKGTATKWFWIFGDSAVSTLQNPVHTYTDTGKFNVQLIVWNNGCSDSIILKDYIRINAPVAKFHSTMDCKKPFERVFIDGSIGADEWNWDFADGTTSTQQSPIHQFTAAGFYEVSLLVKNNATGCDFTTKKIIQIVETTWK